MAKYEDRNAVIQIIGSIYLNPSILDNEDYSFNEEDFVEEFHQILFGSIYNLHTLGAKEISPMAIEDYLEQRPKKLATYKVHKGSEYLQKLIENTQISTSNETV